MHWDGGMKRLKEPKIQLWWVWRKIMLPGGWYYRVDDREIMLLLLFLVGGGGRWLRQHKASTCIFVVSCNLVLSVFEVNIWADRIIDFQHVSVTPSLFHISVSHQLGYWLPLKHALGPLQPTNLFFPPFVLGGGRKKPIKLHSKAAFRQEGITSWTIPTLRCQMLPRKILLEPLLLAKILGFFYTEILGPFARLLVSMMTSRDGSIWKKRQFRRGALWKLFAAEYSPRLDAFGWHNLWSMAIKQILD